MKFTFPPESKPLEGYTIKRAIARGGFGEVYYALSDAGKEVALKLLGQNLEVELRGVSQCLNLNHPNLVSIFDIRTDKQGDHWIIMEYVSGKTLDRVLDESPGPMPLKDVCHWMSEISAGLTYLHSRGLVHRDLKPANIFEHQGTIKIGDVGLSKFISESQAHAQTQSVGTVYYMAPEVAHGRYGKPVDVYALGVMLFEMITGEVPFDGESQAEILMKHLSEPPDLNRLPARLRPVLARALEKDPGQRYQSSAELVSALERGVKDLESGRDFVETVYFETPPQRPAHQPPPQPRPRRAPQRTIERNGPPPHDRYRYSRYATPGERRGGGLGAGKWVLIGIVLYTFLFGIRMGGASFRLLMMGGMIAAIIYAIKRFSAYASGTPVYADSRPIDRRPNPQPTREELRAYALERRERRMAAVEQRRNSVRQVREKRRAEKIARRHHRGYANVSHTVKRAIPLRQRVSELSSSATLATFTTAIITAGLLLTSGLLVGPRVALFGAVTLLGAWALLTTAKFLEGGDHGWSHKRLVFLLVGAFVGVAAWFISTNLFVTFTPSIDGDMDRNRSIGNMLLTDVSGQPMLPAFAMYFAGLFALRRWGWHADSFRDRRFRLSSVMLTTMIGAMWGGAIGLPMLWSVIWAAALCCVVQLSASWTAPEDRHRLMMEAQDHA